MRKRLCDEARDREGAGWGFFDAPYAVPLCLDIRPTSPIRSSTDPDHSHTSRRRRLLDGIALRPRHLLFLLETHEGEAAGATQVGEHDEANYDAE